MSEHAGAGSTSPPTLPGGRYDVTAKLGEGGMATVYRAFDKRQDHWCAVKVLLAKFSRRARIRMRFEAEAKAMARLKHRNVIKVYDVYTEGGAPFFVMELAEGGCLVDWLEAYGAMPPRLACDVAIQICKGLGAAHRSGVIHRDIKPHNILVNRRGVCKITDFGIAQFDEDSASLTKTGSVMGTLGFIAPEQRSNAKDVDERSDLYSVGATLYTMLTARTTMDLFFADQEPEMLAGIPDVLLPIVTRATRYRREDRYRSVRDLAKALHHAKVKLPVDPPDTPSLVMKQSEYEHDTAGNSESDEDPVSVSSAIGLSTASDKTETPTPFRTARPTVGPGGNGPVGAVGDPVATSQPSLSRDALLRDRSRAEAELRNLISMRKLARRIALAAAPLVLVLFVGMFLVLQGAGTVGEAEQRALLDMQTWFDVVDAEKELLNELEPLGADPAPVKDMYADLAALGDPFHRARATSAYQIEVRQLLATHTPSPNTGSGLRARATKTRQRLARMEDAHEQYLTTLGSWRESARRFPGRFAVELGVSSRPPDH